MAVKGLIFSMTTSAVAGLSSVHTIVVLQARGTGGFTELKRRRRESANSAGCESIAHFLSHRSSLTKSIHPEGGGRGGGREVSPSNFSVSFFNGLLKRKSK